MTVSFNLPPQVGYEHGHAGLVVPLATSPPTSPLHIYSHLHRVAAILHTRLTSLLPVRYLLWRALTTLTPTLGRVCSIHRHTGVTFTALVRRPVTLRCRYAPTQRHLHAHTQPACLPAPAPHYTYLPTYWLPSHGHITYGSTTPPVGSPPPPPPHTFCTGDVTYPAYRVRFFRLFEHSFLVDGRLRPPRFMPPPPHACTPACSLHHTLYMPFYLHHMHAACTPSHTPMPATCHACSPRLPTTHCRMPHAPPHLPYRPHALF